MKDNKEQTAMQRHIAALKLVAECSTSEDFRKGLNLAIATATELLPVERKTVEDAFENGYKIRTAQDIGEDIPDYIKEPKIYFTSKYNNE